MIRRVFFAMISEFVYGVYSAFMFNFRFRASVIIRIYLLSE